jgi:hypothetical protein
MYLCGTFVFLVEFGLLFFFIGLPVKYKNKIYSLRNVNCEIWYLGVWMGLIPDSLTFW